MGVLVPLPIGIYIYPYSMGPKVLYRILMNERMQPLSPLLLTLEASKRIHSHSHTCVFDLPSEQMVKHCPGMRRNELRKLDMPIP
jgi:hypothetical protein